MRLGLLAQRSDAKSDACEDQIGDPQGDDETGALGGRYSDRGTPLGGTYRAPRVYPNGTTGDGPAMPQPGGPAPSSWSTSIGS